MREAFLHSFPGGKSIPAYKSINSDSADSTVEIQINEQPLNEQIAFWVSISNQISDCLSRKTQEKADFRSRIKKIFWCITIAIGVTGLFLLMRADRVDHLDELGHVPQPSLKNQTCADAFNMKTSIWRCVPGNNLTVSDLPEPCHQWCDMSAAQGFVISGAVALILTFGMLCCLINPPYCSCGPQPGTPINELDSAIKTKIESSDLLLLKGKQTIQDLLAAIESKILGLRQQFHALPEKNPSDIPSDSPEHSDPEDAVEQQSSTP